MQLDCPWKKIDLLLLLSLAPEVYKAEDIGSLMCTRFACTDCTMLVHQNICLNMKTWNSDIVNGVRQFIGLILICDDSLDLGSCSTSLGACCLQF